MLIAVNLGRRYGRSTELLPLKIQMNQSNYNLVEYLRFQNYLK